MQILYSSCPEFRRYLLVKLIAQRSRAVVFKCSHLSLELIVYGQERSLNGLFILSPHDQVGNGGGTYEGGSCDVVGGIARLGLNALAGEAHVSLSGKSFLGSRTLSSSPGWVACEFNLFRVIPIAA